MALGNALFEALKNSSGVNLPQLERARMLGNQISGNMGGVQNIISPTGTVSPNLFSDAPSGGFSILPHEVARFTKASTLAVPSGVLTEITGWSTAVSWSHGLDVDYTNGKLLLSGLKQNIYLYAGWVSITGNSSGYREVRLTGTGIAVSLARIATWGAADDTIVPFTYFHRPNAANEDVSVSVIQNSGATLKVTLATWGIARIR